MADYLVTDIELTDVADAIRAKADIETQLQWPTGYINTIQSIVADGSDADLISSNIKSGVNILGTVGDVMEAPSWIAGSNRHTGRYYYMNTAISWDDIFPQLNYSAFGVCIVATEGDTTDAMHLIAARQVQTNDYVLLAYQAATKAVTVIYSTITKHWGAYIFDSYIAFRAVSGWNNATFASTNDRQLYPVALSGLLQAVNNDLSQLWATTPIAFGQQEKTVAVSTTEQIITPDTGYSSLSKVTVDGVRGEAQIDTTDAVDVVQKATARISETDRAKLIPGNIRYGEYILGVVGTLQERPSWVPGSFSSGFTDAYMNPNIDWDTILPNLTYNDDGIAVLGATDEFYGIFNAFKDGNKYALGLTCLNPARIIPIYATTSWEFSITVEHDEQQQTTISADFIEGWNNLVVHLPNPTPCGFSLDVVDLGVDPTTIASGDELAFGRWTKKPTAGTTLTITANGTYTFEQLSQYETIIIDVPTSSSSSDENVAVSGDTMSFDGDTTVSGDTLILDANAEMSGDTLIFAGANDPAVSGNDLVFDGNEAVSGDTLALDGTVEGDTIMI